MHGIRYKWYLIENDDDDDTNDDNDDNDDDHYGCNSVTRSHKAHLYYYFFVLLFVRDQPIETEQW